MECDLGLCDEPSKPPPSVPSKQTPQDCFELIRCGEFKLPQRPDNITDKNWDVYMRFWRQLEHQDSPFILSDGRIEDQYLIAILIRIELNGASGKAYQAALEALSSQYKTHCSGGCASLEEQLNWLGSMQGWWDRGSRPISINDCPWCMQDAAKAITGYQDEYDSQSWWWGNPLRDSSLANYVTSTFPNTAQGGLMVDGNKFIVGQRGGVGVLDFVILTYQQGQECYSTIPNCMGFSPP